MAGENSSKNPVKECNICGAELTENEEYCPECGADFTPQNRYNY